MKKDWSSVLNILGRILISMLRIGFQLVMFTLVSVGIIYLIPYFFPTVSGNQIIQMEFLHRSHLQVLEASFALAIILYASQQISNTIFDIVDDQVEVQFEGYKLALYYIWNFVTKLLRNLFSF